MWPYQKVATWGSWDALWTSHLYTYFFYPRHFLLFQWSIHIKNNVGFRLYFAETYTLKFFTAAGCCIVFQLHLFFRVIAIFFSKNYSKIIFIRPNTMKKKSDALFQNNFHKTKSNKEKFRHAEILLIAYEHSHAQ